MLPPPNTLNFPAGRQSAEFASVRSASIPEVRDSPRAPVPPPPVATAYHRWWSPRLRQDIEFQVHGHAGLVLLLFPPAGGRFYDFDHNGLLHSARGFLEQGLVRCVSLDSFDLQSWASADLPTDKRIARADAIDLHITRELIPFLRSELSVDGPFGAAGCSWGGFHAINLVLRHPDLFQQALGMSGLYDLSAVIPDGVCGGAYFHSPLHYLPNLSDPWFLDRIRTARVILAAGQAACEQRSADHARRLGDVFQAKGLPVWMDLWGGDVTHDWHWWQRMFPYFLNTWVGR